MQQCEARTVCHRDPLFPPSQSLSPQSPVPSPSPRAMRTRPHRVTFQKPSRRTPGVASPSLIGPCCSSVAFFFFFLFFFFLLDLPQRHDQTAGRPGAEQSPGDGGPVITRDLKRYTCRKIHCLSMRPNATFPIFFRANKRYNNTIVQNIHLPLTNKCWFKKINK